jgi:2-desacetyl-2-hydroxyethyl bacteriochlorophyllide A dehydrogenase
MWTSTLDLDLKRILLTRLLSRFWPGAYFSSFAPLRVQQLPRQPLAASNWVRVRNRLAGVCGSDLQLLTANGDPRISLAALPQYKYLYPGHEVIGEVIEIGDDVQHLHVGDRVALQYSANCVASGLQTVCRSCAEGCYNLCENSVLPSPTQIGGGWSEEMLLSEQQLYKVSMALSDEQAVLLEPAAIAVHAVLRHLPHPGERVLIIGAGTIGLLTLQVVRALAPQSEISVLARHPFQVEQATRMGAAHIIYPQDSYVGIQRVTHAQIYRGIPGNQMLTGGYDVIFDTVGKRRTLHHALRWAATRATVVLVGIDLHLMNIDLTPLWHQEINLLGSRAHGLENWPPGSLEQQSSFAIASELIEQGYMHPEFLITHHYALNNYQNALRTAIFKAQSRAIKVVFDYSLLPASVVPNVRASARRRRTAMLDENSDQQVIEALEEQDISEQDDPPTSPDKPYSTPQPQDEPYSTPQPRKVSGEKRQQPSHPGIERFPQAPLTQMSEPSEPIEYADSGSDEEDESIIHDPHALPTLREEEFLSYQPDPEPENWAAENDYASSQEGEPIEEEDLNEEASSAISKSSANSFPSTEKNRYEMGRNASRQRNTNKKSGRR